MLHKVRSLLPPISRVVRTGFLLRSAGLNNRAAVPFSFRRWLRWRLAPRIKVSPGVFKRRGRITLTHILEVYDA